MRPSRPEDYISSSTSVTPEEGEAPLWEKFLREACGGDEKDVEFLRLWCGYCLTGHTSEQSVVFLHGPGGTGKSTFINVLSYLLKDYHVSAKMETFMRSGREDHPTEIAWLEGGSVSDGERDGGT